MTGGRRQALTPSGRLVAKLAPPKGQSPADPAADPDETPENNEPLSNEELTGWKVDVDRTLNTYAGLFEDILVILEDAAVGGRYHWDHLPPEKKAALMRRLVAFVGWLDRTYLQQITTLELKPCWWQHPDVVWQLTALMVAHGSVYNVAAKPTMDLVTFHTHALWPTLERIAANGSLRRCERGKHEQSAIAALEVDETLVAQLREWEGEGHEAYSLALGGGTGSDSDRDPSDGSGSGEHVDHPDRHSDHVDDPGDGAGDNADRDPTRDPNAGS